MWLGLLACAVFIRVFSGQYVVIYNDCVCCCYSGCLLGRWWSVCSRNPVGSDTGRARTLYTWD